VTIDTSVIDSGYMPYILGTVIAIGLFIGVLIHEIAHSLVALKNGIRINSITLLFFGGISSMDEGTPDPKVELPLALVGPLASLGIGLVCIPLVYTAGFLVADPGTEGVFVFTIGYLGLLNILLFAFNLIPAFPMDGGRVLRAGLAMKMDYAKATSMAATIGQGFAVVFGIVGLFTNPFLILIAVFIWFSAAGESQVTQTQAQLAGVPVERAMLTSFDTLSPINSLRYVSQLVLAGSQQGFPVIENGKPIGLVTRADLFTALTQYGPLGFVAQAMCRDFATVEADEALAAAAEKLQTRQARSMIVLRDGQLAGLLTPENVQEFALIQAALEKNRRSDKIEAMRTT